MGGAAPEPTSKGGKKPMDAALNLVPYIDLLMTIMTFLMMTAVWTQISMLEVQNASGGQEQDSEPDPNAPKPLLVLVTDRAVKVQEEGGELQEFPSTGDGYDFTGVKNVLDAFKKSRPERQVVKIQSEDGVQYENLVKLIDICTGLDLKAITLTPTGA